MFCREGYWKEQSFVFTIISIMEVVKKKRENTAVFQPISFLN